MNKPGPAWKTYLQDADKRNWLLVIHIQEEPGADPGFFQRGGSKYESSRQTFQGQGMGEGELEGNVWIRRFSTLWSKRYKFVKYETLLLRTKSTVQQRYLFVKQTSLKEPSWMSFYKGLLAYLVFLESLGVVYGDLLWDQNLSSSVVDL